MKYSEAIREIDNDLFGISEEIWDNIGNAFSTRINESLEQIDTLRSTETELQGKIQTLQDTLNNIQTDKDTAVDIATRQSALLNDTLAQTKKYKERVADLLGQVTTKDDEIIKSQKAMTDAMIASEKLKGDFEESQRQLIALTAQQELTQKTIASQQVEIGEGEKRVKKAKDEKVAVCLEKPIDLTMDSIEFHPDQVIEIATMALKSAVAHNVDIKNKLALDQFLSGWITETEHPAQRSGQESLNEILQVSEAFESRVVGMLDAYLTENVEKIVDEILPLKVAINEAKIKKFDKIIESISQVGNGNDINIFESMQEFNGLRHQLDDAKAAEECMRRDLFKAQADLIVESRSNLLPIEKSNFIKNRVKNASTPGEAETMINEAIDAYERERAAFSRQTLKRKSPGAVERVDEHLIVPSQQQSNTDEMSSYIRGVKSVKL